jgi:carboxymethylenebutenolidase
MCDEKTFADAEDYPSRSGELTRREFGTLTAGVGLAMLWPEFASANPAEVVGRDVEITTPDGQADCYFVHPSTGKHPGVLLWPDAFGMRAAMRQMGERLARSGYSVLVVNPYYRNAKAPILPDGADFTDPATRDKLMSMMKTLSAETQTTDAKAFVDFLDAQPSVDLDRKIGTMGYCMGGPMTMRTAAVRADRVGAAASFHGGRLVVEGDDSPHLLIPKIKAQYLFAIAVNDDEKEPEVKNVLREAFAKNGLTAEIKVYEGTLHGWCPPDSRVYNEAQAERAWRRLHALFERALKESA